MINYIRISFTCFFVGCCIQHITFPQKSFKYTVTVLNTLDNRHFVLSDLVSNCLQSLSAENDKKSSLTD